MLQCLTQRATVSHTACYSALQRATAPYSALQRPTAPYLVLIPVGEPAYGARQLGPRNIGTARLTGKACKVGVEPPEGAHGPAAQAAVTVLYRIVVYCIIIQYNIIQFKLYCIILYYINYLLGQQRHWSTGPQ